METSTPHTEGSGEEGADRDGPGPRGLLDPGDWADFRETAHAVLDHLVDYLRNVRERPVWRPVPDELPDRVGDRPPREPAGLEEAWEEARDSILPHPVGNIHPRFFGWVHGTGTPGGVVAEMIAAAMNVNVGGRDHAAVHVERRVVDWWRQVFGLPEGATGVLTTGTSMANLVGLAVARNASLDRDVRLEGLGEEGGRLRAYASSWTHGSVQKALEVLGLGRRSLVEVPADGDHRVDVTALERRVARDRDRGLEPFCVIGNAGTVDAGAVDDLRGLGELCGREGLWYHVDGAFGALAVLDDDLRALVDGIETVDSLAFDFHKWLHVPYDAGCVLVREGERHRETFATRDAYLRRDPGGIGGGDPWFTDFGVELSRGFRALKVWMTMREHGLDRIGRAVRRNCEQARHLVRQVEASDELERMAPVALNIVCFRYAPPSEEAATSGGDVRRSGGGGAGDGGGDAAGAPGGTAPVDDGLDELNRRILDRLHREGTAAPSSTTLGGEFALRVALTNHRTKRADLDLLVDRVTAIGRQLRMG